MLPLPPPALYLLLKGDAALRCDRADCRDVVLILLIVVVLYVEGLELLDRLHILSVGPALEGQLARARLGVVGAVGILLDSLHRRVEPALRDKLVVDRALNENRRHLAARLVLLVV